MTKNNTRPPVPLPNELRARARSAVARVNMIARYFREPALARSSVDKVSKEVDDLLSELKEIKPALEAAAARSDMGL